jgi:hypothetical protein
MTIHKVYLDRIISETDLDTLKGYHIHDGYIHHLFNYDCDVYDSDTYELILSFRKNRLKTSKTAWDNYRHLAVASRGRGASAGQVDPNSKYWKKRTLYKTKGYSTGYLKPDGTPSKMRVNNQVASIPIGYFEKTKSLGIDKPCRLSYHTSVALDKFNGGKPYIHELDKWYKKLNHKAYHHQKTRADKQPKYRIDNTAFSTITMNRNFRTALHKDAGDYGNFAVLSVLEYGKYNGGLFMIPAYGIGINLRENDVLVANVHEYHCNSEIWTTPEQDTHNKSLPVEFKKDTTVGTIGLDLDYSRISFVSYLREKLIDCDT